MNERKIRVGLAQYAPIHNDLVACLDKMETIMSQAHKEDLDLLAFGETWLSGYPAWIDHCPNIALWDDSGMKKAYRQLVENSIELGGDEIRQIASRVAEYKLPIVLGINERVGGGPGNGTLYNTVLVFDKNGKIKVHHRKLMPTYTEKMLYGLGEGQGLEATDLSFGRIGALICWEHWMPLTRQAMHNSGEQIHIALWPQVHEMLQLASRHYAFEGRCYVLAVGQIMTAAQIPSELELPDHLKDRRETQILNGGSCIIGPDGQYIIEPQFGNEELIVARESVRVVNDQT
jgi:nitrilase